MVASKGLTEAIRLRWQAEERALAVETQRVYGAAGVEMSLNDTLRHLVRRAGIVLACTPPAAWEQITQHAAGCSDCDAGAERFGCPDGLYMYRNWRRVLRDHQGTEAANAL